jgi:hypothetical protein
MNKISVQDLLEEDFDFSKLKITSEEIDKIFESVEKKVGKAKIFFNSLKNNDKIHFVLGSLLHWTGDSGKALIYSILDNFGDFDDRDSSFVDFSLRLLFNKKQRDYFDSKTNLCLKNNTFPFSNHLFRYLDCTGSLYSVFGNYSDDFYDYWVHNSINSNKLSLDRITEIVNNGMQKKYELNIYNSYILETLKSYSYLVKKDNLSLFLRNNKDQLPLDFKHFCYKTLSDSSLIDEMIEDESYEVRLLAISFLDSRDIRLVKFCRDPSKLVFDSALSKVHIKYVPMFASSRHLKKAGSDQLFKKRISDRS